MKVKTIVGVIPKAYMDMDKTTFTSEDGKTAYTFASIVEGGDYDGDFVTDKAGNLQFKKAKNWLPNTNVSGGSKAKEFKADPLKQASIEKQVALKCAVDLLSAKLPQMKTQPKSGALAEAAITIAKSFDEFLKEVPVEEKAEAEEDKEEVKALLDSAEEVNVDEINL